MLCDLDLIIFDQESLEYAHDFQQVITNITNSPVATVDGHNPLMDVKFGYVFLEKTVASWDDTNPCVNCCRMSMFFSPGKLQ